MINFDILIVCLNPGDELVNTLKSVISQDYSHYRVKIKDGGSTDGFLEKAQMLIEGDERFTFIQKNDTGIYDAMNQAAAGLKGDYAIFLNCGDYFYDNKVLSMTADFIEKDGSRSDIYYGDIYDRLRNTHVSSAPKITPFVCFRNVPCHQACFYSKGILAKRLYDTKYRVRADYDHFLASYFLEGVRPEDLGITVASYEGGGYSETPKGLEISQRERKEILKKYYSPIQIKKYEALLILSLAPLRRAISQAPVLSGLYQKLKSVIYGK